LIIVAIKSITYGRYATTITTTSTNLTNLERIDVDSRNPNYFSDQGVFYTKSGGGSTTTLTLYPAKKAGRSYAIPSGVTDIAGGSFSGNELIGEVTIPESVINIDATPFANCKNLETVNYNARKATIAAGGLFPVATVGVVDTFNVNIGNTVVEIPAVFGIPGNTNIKSITIPESVQKITTGAFTTLPNLETVNLEANLSDSAEAFANPAIRNVNIGSRVIRIGGTLFSVTDAAHSASITTIGLPSGLRFIEAGAFQFCSALASIVIPASVVSIEDGAFSSCTKLSPVEFMSSTVAFNAGAFQAGGAETLLVAYAKGGTGSYYYAADIGGGSWIKR